MARAQPIEAFRNFGEENRMRKRGFQQPVLIKISPPSRQGEIKSQRIVIKSPYF